MAHSPTYSKETDWIWPHNKDDLAQVQSSSSRKLEASPFLQSWPQPEVTYAALYSSSDITTILTCPQNVSVALTLGTWSVRISVETPRSWLGVLVTSFNFYAKRRILYRLDRHHLFPLLSALLFIIHFTIRRSVIRDTERL